ncbi:Siderophore export accessory protein MmpS5 [Mycobacterium simulans]|uniref:MmpS family transport accessory protein n=1 Tax=Mycobacterium simulans TaxID=627089 RepID=UPI00174A5FB7|nr:MmpS family transport accessory protein [Mycobacterium simulans]SON62139.1 Siderophore export accessory protein MmpS5 [Mycobacterium simulans]
MKHLGGPSILFAVGIGLAATCGVANADPMPQVRYEVSGSGLAEYISYQTVEGQQHAVNVPLPWKTEFSSFGAQVFVLSAQGPGTISCRILLDGNVVNQQTSTGLPGRAACSH